VEGSPAHTTLSAVRKRFGRRADWVLDGVDLDLTPGSTTVVVGANGSGKSTLPRIVAGLARPTAGRVARAHATMGYAPDRLGARVRMSARVYVEHMARIRRIDPHDGRARADALFARLGLRPGPDTPIGSLSKGNSQKVALTQALVAPVDLLILDEPYGGLDVQARDAVSEIIGERARHGTAVLVSAHAPLDTLGAARTLRLERGRLRAAAAVHAATRVVLSSRHGTADARALRTVAGVVDARVEGDTVILSVEPDAVDDLLAFAIATDWSVTAVVPPPG
jgi:ABC-type multidrug transport system ATPase subunit